MAGIRAVFVSLVVLAAWAVGHAEDASQGEAKLALRAEGLLLARCAVCHSTDLVTQQRIDRNRWEATIKKMMHWGAEITDEEAAMLTDHLSSRYHPTAPDVIPSANAEEATQLFRVESALSEGPLVGNAGHGETLFAVNCQACHGSGAAGGVGPRLAGNPILGDESRFWDTVLHGRGAMPAWEAALSAQDISDIRAWLHTIR
jgi:cytochrome c oxidase cbb3-type subunit 3